MQFDADFELLIRTLGSVSNLVCMVAPSNTAISASLSLAATVQSFCNGIAAIESRKESAGSQNYSPLFFSRFGKALAKVGEKGARRVENTKVISV